MSHGAKARRVTACCVLLAFGPAAAPGQASGTRGSFGAEAVAVATRAAPTVEGRRVTELALSQPALSFTGSTASLYLHAMLNGEGLLMPDGELTTGSHGEGFVDRRHPHTYLHELMGGVRSTWGDLGVSAAGGRGFVPFGSDDPMVRPFQKYPVNHHLAQILERYQVVGAVRRGPIIVEAALFNGDEPTSPSSVPRQDRLFDSWSTRLTVAGLRMIPGLELSGSHAWVISPEIPFGGGLDQRKWSAVSRWADAGRYLLAEWARTDSRTRFGRPAGSFRSLLAEGAACVGVVRGGLRLEQTDRPEEERLEDPFRTSHPATDNSNLGVTRWFMVTTSLATRTSAGALRLAPFVEVAGGRPRALKRGSTFEPVSYYGASTLWMVSAGTRVGVGHRHARMGRYGVADVSSRRSGPPGHDSHASEDPCAP